MEPLEHYKVFIEADHKHVVLVLSSKGRLSITSVKRLNSESQENNKADKSETKKYTISCQPARLAELISELDAIDLLILHDDYPADPVAITRCNHLDLLKICYQYCVDGGDVVCNARNIRCVKQLPIDAGIRRLLSHNIFTHRAKIRRSGFHLRGQHSIVSENGYPDKIVSFSLKLRQLYYYRSQPQRTFRGRILVLLLVYSGLAHFFEPGYLFKLQK